MVYIFHGDNQLESRKAFSDFLDQFSDAEIFRLDSKNIDLDKTNLFLQESSLFGTKKILSISNFFSTDKSILNKIINLINQNNETEVVIWQDKTLTPIQTKTFKDAQIKNFPLDNKLFSCLNAIKPKNLTRVIPLYDQVINLGLYDLFLYFLKNNFRKQLISYPKFNPSTVKKVYLQLIELDFQNKIGELSIPKELALKRIIINLTK